MLQAVTDALYEHLIDVFPPTRAYADADLSPSPMPVPVAHFLRRALQHQVELELGEQFGKMPAEWFDYDHPDVQAAYRTLLSSIEARAHIPAERWEVFLQHAVQHTVSYLVQPVRTLVEFVYPATASEVLPSALVLKRLAYFHAYPYLATAIVTYLNRDEPSGIDKKRFASILTHIDQHMTGDYTEEQWVGLLEPLSNLVRIAPVSTQAGIPAALLNLFFTEKEQSTIVDRLQTLQETHGVEALATAGIRQLVSPDEEEVSPPPAPSPEETPSPPPAGPVPLWKQFQHGTTAPPPTQPPPSPKPIPVAEKPEPPGEAVPLWMQFAPETPTEPTGSPALTSLEKGVLGEEGPQHREQFVTHLFSGSEEAYEHVLEQLQNVPDWAQASRVVAQQVFKKYRVNIYSEPAVLFTNLLEARYRGW